MFREDLNNLRAADRLPALCSKTPQACKHRHKKHKLYTESVEDQLATILILVYSVKEMLAMDR